jgi:outer membrane beta-barrel protein
LAVAAMLVGAAAAADEPAEPAGLPEVPVRVQRRAIHKRHRAEMTLAFAYLERGDFYQNPGLMATLGYWPWESLELEAQLATWSAVETDAAKAVREETGFLPDSHREKGSATAGVRWSLAYGKALFGESHVIYFDPQLFAHVGAHFAEGATGVMVDFGVGLAMRPLSRLELRLDVAAVAQSERRSAGTVGIFGVMPSLSVGVLL